jgi:hypothetical protein
MPSIRTALRTLLIHGARAVIRMAAAKPEMADSWLMKQISAQRIGYADSRYPIPTFELAQGDERRVCPETEFVGPARY